MNAPQIATVALKLGFSGAVIFTIAAAFVIVSDDGEVSEAKADLYDLHSADVYQHEDFQRVLEDSGLEPRPYDHNGNFVNFAVGDSDLTPEELLEYYQHKFKRAGINSKVYDEAMFSALARHQEADDDELLDAQDALLRGEMVPLSITEDHVAMGGLLGSFEPDDDAEDFKEQLQSQDLSRFATTDELHDHLDNLSKFHLPPTLGHEAYDDDIEGFRYLEAHREPGTSNTTVTSTWSDGEFDADKVTDPDATGVGTDDIPACIGCERDNRLQALGDDEPYVLNQFRTTSTPGEVTSFYERALTQRDWSPTEAEKGLRELTPQIPELQQMPGDMVSFERGEEFITVFVPEKPHQRTGERSVVTLREESHPAH